MTPWLKTSRWTLSLLVCSFALSVGCGGSDSNPADASADAIVADAGDPGECPTTGRLLPLATGTQWTFLITDLTDGTTEEKTQTIGAIEDVGPAKPGVQGFRVTTQKVAGQVVSWQEDTGTAIHRHRERDEAGGSQTDEIYEPYKLRVDESSEHTTLGASWTTTYVENATSLSDGATSTTDKTETWSIEAVDEAVTVPAGTFCALRIRRISTGTTGGSDKQYWFVRGVGKVKEESALRREELSGYSIP